jgi:hypothetical protein
MTISPHTTTLVAAIERHARSVLTHRDEVRVLIELAHSSGKLQQLDELSFVAKFAHKTFGIMQRIGNDAEGHDKLSNEFTNAVEKSKSLIRSLLERSDDETRNRIGAEFLDLTPTAFQNLLTLMYDLSRYKNYRLDSLAATDRFAKRQAH